MFNRIVRSHHIVDKDQSKHGELDLPQWPAFVTVLPTKIELSDKCLNYKCFVSHFNAVKKVIKPDEFIRVSYRLTGETIYQLEQLCEEYDSSYMGIDIEYRLVTQNTRTWYLDINVITDQESSKDIEGILNIEFMCQCPFNLYINGR